MRAESRLCLTSFTPKWRPGEQEAGHRRLRVYSAQPSYPTPFPPFRAGKRQEEEAKRQKHGVETRQEVA